MLDFIVFIITFTLVNYHLKSFQSVVGVSVMLCSYKIFISLKNVNEPASLM